jgi:hypothetical protein
VAMRFGTSQEGLPINVQIVGKWQAESTILHVASLLEAVSPVRGLHPSLILGITSVRELTVPNAAYLQGLCVDSKQARAASLHALNGSHSLWMRFKSTGLNATLWTRITQQATLQTHAHEY